MSELPSHEDVEKWVGEMPRGVLAKLPEGEKRSRAAEHINAAERLAHELRETAPNARAGSADTADACSQ